MAGLKRFEKENGLPGWQGLVWAGGCAALALVANTDYHAIGVLIICTLYLTRADRKRQCLAGALLFCSSSPRRWPLCWSGSTTGSAARAVRCRKRPFTGSTRCTCWCWQVSRTLFYNSRKPAVQRQRAFTASHIGNIAPVSSSMAGTVTSIHTVEWATA